VEEPLAVRLAYAQAGDPGDQLNVGVAYLKGDGVPKDAAKGAEWFRKAAAGGLPRAQFNLGICLARGEGVPEDAKEAARWFQAAALQGLFPAQLALIEAYSKGLGLEKSPRAALAWDFLARRTLQLEEELPVEPPPHPPAARADGTFASPPVRPPAADLPSPIAIPAMRVPARLGEWVAKPKRPLAGDLALLAQLEEQAQQFAGAGEKDYEQAKAAAAQFLIAYRNPPQKPVRTDWFSQHAAAPTAAELPQPRLVETPDDRSSLYPLGLNGREAIRANPWKHAETDHFVVHYMQASDAYPVMRYIEAAYYVVTHALQVEDKADKRKSHVFIFPGSNAWNSWLQAHGLPPEVAGYAYKDELLVGSGEERDEYVKTVCHEATHAIVARYYPARPLPLWLNEGFAEYMGAKAVAFKRGQNIQRYFRPNAEAAIDLDALVHCVDSGISRVFYADSEKTVRALLEKLPPASFPRFVNLTAAGNGPDYALPGAYGSACPSTKALTALVLGLTTTEPSVLQAGRRR
jgi:hypothetical protein